MKPLMILGAAVGFSIGMLFAVVPQAHVSWPTALFRASAAALIASVLFRWWARVWLKSLRAALEQQQAERARSKETQTT